MIWIFRNVYRGVLFILDFFKHIYFGPNMIFFVCFSKFLPIFYYFTPNNILLFTFQFKKLITYIFYYSFSPNNHKNRKWNRLQNSITLTRKT